MTEPPSQVTCVIPGRVRCPYPPIPRRQWQVEREVSACQAGVSTQPSKGSWGSPGVRTKEREQESWLLVGRSDGCEYSKGAPDEANANAGKTPELEGVSRGCEDPKEWRTSPRSWLCRCPAPAL